ncbi:MAG TPA: tetratricopeptide repeat protein [Gaiellaceae bacterium]|nr:tetratricopeptide repeat protein [Gaiellaceae bacterium]
MRELPGGTVTFLFTDIEGSTKLLHELGDAYADALAEHRLALREVFSHHGGVEVDTQGDAFFYAFARAGDALAAAGEAQAALAEGPIRVRMGIHTGEPIVTDEGYVGLDVHRAARIAGVGHGAQVLVSSATTALLDPSNTVLLDLGEHRLKDLTAPERIYQLGEGEFPPLRSLNQSNLPEQPTPFAGREKEFAEVLVLVRNPRIRLVTLTGAGGSGKTRLAVQTAAEVVDEHEHGVWWVSLQAVRDAELVLPSVASVVGAQGDLAAHIGDRRLLLVLDNLEQVLDAAPALGGLLAACPNLELIATSREPLRLAAEHEYAVPPFAVQEGVGFFLSRARVVRRDFEPDERVLEICRRLDNLPLALELAAARVRVLSTAQMLDRLEHALPLLTGGTRDAPERQRTLRATIGWSYDLLDAVEQQAFRRLGVFAGGCTLDAAERVAGADLDVLQSLVEKSLVRFDGERHSLLETIREYALERLEEAGEAEERRRAHAAFFLALAEEADLSAEGNYGQRYELVPPDQDNLRAAIDWALASGEIELGLRLAVALEQFWVIADPYEGVRRFEALLARADDVAPLLRARTLRCLGACRFISGDYERAQPLMEESLALFRAAGDEEGAAVILHRLAIGNLSMDRPELSREPLQESLELFVRSGNRRGEAESIGTSGYLAEAEGRLEEALDFFEQSRTLAVEVGFDWWVRNMLLAAAAIELKLGRVEEGERSARGSLAAARELGDRRGTVLALAMLAWAAADRGDALRAGLLWGAIEAEEQRGPLGQWERHRDEYSGHVLAAEGPEFTRAREEGRRLSLERAAEKALA